MAKPYTGSLRKNDKEGNDKRPDYKGRITLAEGEDYWISAWINTDRETGGKYMSLKLEKVEPMASAGDPKPF
jgi:uncharacterized protein (DUF736 family)